MPAAVAALFLAGELAFRLAWFGPAALLRPWDYSAASSFERGLVEPDPDPRILWRLVPGRRSMLKGARFTTNTAGFRGPEIAREKAPGEHRIAVVGASITVGVGVDDETPYARQAEARLHELGHGEVTVLNAGVQNYEASQIVAAYETHVRAFAPDAVVVPVYPGLFPRTDVPEVGALARRDPGDLSVRRLLAPLFLTKALRAWMQDGPGRLLASDWQERAHPVPRGADRPTFESIMDDFATSLDADGTPLFLLLLPKADHPPRRRLVRLREQADELAARHRGATVLDVLPEVAPRVSEADRVYPGDRHPNARYHALVGRALAEALRPYLPAP